MIEKVTNKENLYQFFQKDVFLFAYHLGDLDDFFFHNCTWYGYFENDQLSELILLFTGLSIPTLLVFGFSKIAELLEEILDDLPERFFCHYQQGLESIFLQRYNLEYFGTHLKMKFQKLPSNLVSINNSQCIKLTSENTNEVTAFYEKAYPNSYFESFMLETGKYFGLIEDNEIKSIAGVHVYSKNYNIAVLGNIATDPLYRRLGHATSCILALMLDLINEVHYIGLNVKVTNIEAINLYKKIGFIPHSKYEEGLFKIKGMP